ncbi:carbohydrate ABC transporter permease [Streptacidiphilus sp. N1-12]|uniref:Carbohydrate ABC transporter permease n=2 Tax=Streptacidiphilus alkalitolerans TaxID=3342712 RepID=A0ABV6VHM1_9ACTN
MKRGILISEHERSRTPSSRRPRQGGTGGAADRAAAADAADRAADPPRGTWSRRRRRVVANLTGWTFAGPATLIIVALTLFPAGWAFLISREHWNGFTPPRSIGWANYRTMASDPDLRAAVDHTVLFTVLYVPIVLVLGIFVATALNRSIRFIAFYRTAVFVPLVVSAAATGILANYVFDPQFGLANNALRALHLPRQGFLTDRHEVMWVIALIYLWGDLAFSVIVYLAALQDIPQDIVEAATLDGANRWQVFRHVTLPAVAPITVFVGVWETVSVLQIFELVLTTTRGGPLGSSQTVVYFIYNQAFELSRYGYGSAIAYALFAATLLLTLGLFAYSKRSKSEAF